MKRSKLNLPKKLVWNILKLKNFTVDEGYKNQSESERNILRTSTNTTVTSGVFNIASEESKLSSTHIVVTEYQRFSSTLHLYDLKIGIKLLTPTEQMLTWLFTMSNF